MDQYVAFNGKKIHIYDYGRGAVPVVLLSGSGVPFPQLEYRNFAKALAESHRVIGIDKLGYGTSDLSGGNRDMGIVVEEYRHALEASGVRPPFVLAAHSMGFLEALWWRQQYPGEVVGILGIDPATPECYEEFDLDSAIKGLKGLSENERLRRESAAALAEKLIREHQIPPEEATQLEALAYRNLANPDWVSEAERLGDALARIKSNDPYPQIPMMFLISNGEGTGIGKEAWINHALRYLDHIEAAEYALFDFPHTLYQFAYREMADRSRAFITKRVPGDRR